MTQEMNDEDFFDDCPICQLFKSVKKQGRNPTISELKEAFKEAKENGAVVGGEWFSESDK